MVCLVIISGENHGSTIRTLRKIAHKYRIEIVSGYNVHCRDGKFMK
jgi:hypothetical protein